MCRAVHGAAGRAGAAARGVRAPEERALHACGGHPGVMGINKQTNKQTRFISEYRK